MRYARDSSSYLRTQRPTTSDIHWSGSRLPMFEKSGSRGVWVSAFAGTTKNSITPSRALLAGAGGMRLQGADAFGQCPAALRRIVDRRRAVNRSAVGGLSGAGRLGRKQCLDGRVRPFELERESGDFGSDVVDAFA